MPKGVPCEAWQSPKMMKKFRRLCMKAKRPAVDWGKFRELDKHGTFEDIPNATLSAKFRKLRLNDEGLCWNCGKNEMENDNGLCDECIDYFIQARQESNEKRKQEENAE
jgi:hypothetical protein